MSGLEKVGKYPVSRILGQGATSTVYLGWDDFAKRDVALKVISPEILRDPRRGKIYRHLLLNEAALIGKLIHPHIVQIFDAELDEEDLSYVVMEYVSDGTLYQFCTMQNLLPISRVLEIVFKCSRALDYANRLGVTHRDIKPANILLASDRDIRISDFGTAIGLEPDRTQVSGVGSPAYMSPQQVREHPLNHQTDIYSLGVTMYQLLTGRLPFEADTNFNMIYQIIHNSVNPPSTLRMGISPEVDAVVMKAMAKNLEDRYPTWENFSQDLARLFGEPLAVTAKEQDAITDAQKFEILRKLRFFKKFDDVQLWEVVHFASWEVRAAGDYLFHEGGEGDSFSFIVEGEIQVSRRGVALNVLSVGDCVGEIGVVAGKIRPRNANVVALSDLRLITIHRNAIQNATSSCRMHFYYSFLEVMIQRLETANARMSGMESSGLTTSMTNQKL